MKKPKLTLDERLINEEFLKAMKPAERRKRHARVPSLGDILIAEFEGATARLSYLKERRERIMSERPDHWTVKVTLKLDRLVFPELAQGKELTRAQEVARVISLLRARLELQQKDLTVIQSSSILGIRLTDIIMRAVWGQDSDFLKQLGTALEKGNRATGSKGLVYSFLRHHADAVDQCRTPGEIMHLPGFPIIDAGSFYHFCREVGLPEAH